MATKQQIPVIAARVVEFQEEFEKLSTEDAQWAIRNTKEAIAIWIEAIENRTKTTTRADVSILGEIVATISIPATIEKFVAKDNFVVDMSKNAKVKIFSLDDAFSNWFLSVTEDAFTGSTVSGRKLEINLDDGSLLTELGGQKMAGTTLAELYSAMALQPNGEDGGLLNNERENIFYIRSYTGILNVVCVRWFLCGWSVRAGHIKHKHDDLARKAGCRVFSRVPPVMTGN